MDGLPWDPNSGTSGNESMSNFQIIENHQDVDIQVILAKSDLLDNIDKLGK